MESDNLSLRREIVELKDLEERQFDYLTGNFYILKAAVRYYSVKVGKSFTAGQVSEDFPLTIPVAGSGLRMLEKLGVVECRNSSSSANRYMPSKTDFGRLLKIEKILSENYEIDGFAG